MTLISDPMVATLAAHRAATSAADAVGVYSVCSAHPWVLAAAVIQAREDGSAVLIEATSNQVDQDGGYTGMRPADFRDLVHGIADEHGLPRDRIVLGGDHLGPNVWRGLGPEEAMQRAEVLVATYVEAGFTKIHLDCSMACDGDPDALSDATVASRAVRLARVAEAAAGPNAHRLGYVIGTEVPVPGGAHETIDTLAPTTPEAARATIEAHRTAFRAAGLDDAWNRVVAVVVQPGVEFDHLRVFDFEPDQVRSLSAVVADDGLVFEAHSTDYQLRERLRSLVEQHWAVLKVGPGLTFALREALFALAAIEDDLFGEEQRSNLVAVVDEVMLAEPHWWQGYYEGDPAEQRLARHYSYSDRMRYYWPQPTIQAAQQRLLSNLRKVEIPLPMLSAHLPGQYDRVRRGQLLADPQALVIDRVTRRTPRLCGRLPGGVSPMKRVVLRGLLIGGLAATSLVGVSTATTYAAPGPTTIYVAPDGSDAGIGSESDPFATFQHAVDALGKKGGTVLARGGTYNQRIVLRHRDHVTVAAYPGERPVLDLSGTVPPNGTSGVVEIRNGSDLVVRGLEITGYRTTSQDRVPIGIYVSRWRQRAHSQGQPRSSPGERQRRARKL